MSIFNSTPHYETNIEDRSRRTVLQSEFMPLHRPIAVLKAQKGDVGIPIWTESITVAKEKFGEDTFNPRSKYFSLAAFQVMNDLKRCGCFICRVAEASATTASMLLSLEVTPSSTIPVYKKDEYGNYMTAPDGSYEPELDIDGTTPLVRDGFEIRWIKSELAENEEVADLEPVTEGEKVTYPLIAVRDSSPSEYGNRLKLSFSYDKEINTEARVGNCESILVTVGPAIEDTLSHSDTAIRDAAGKINNAMSVKPSALDGVIDYGYESLIDRVYGDVAPYPVDLKFLTENFRRVGEQLMERESTIPGELKANIFSCVDIDGFPYDSVKLVKNIDALMSEDVYIPLQGGSDGNIEQHTIEALTRKFFSGDINPNIQDEARYPFTFVYDVGYHMKTKEAIIDFMSLRNDVFVVLSSQTLCDFDYDNDGNVIPRSYKPNDMMTDIAITSALRNRAVLQRESIIYGTEAFRCIIMNQAGPSIEYPWVNIAQTAWLAERNTQFLNLDRITGVIGGRPSNENHMFKAEDLGWLPYNLTQRTMAWEAGGNFSMVYSHIGTKIQVPGLRTIHPYATSVLFDYGFAIAATLAKHECRVNWSIHVGLTGHPDDINAKVRKDILKRLTYMLGGFFTAECSVYQTTDEALLGYARTADITIRGGKANLVTTFKIGVDRLESGGV